MCFPSDIKETLIISMVFLTERLWQYHPKWKQPKWKYSTFCSLAGITSYPYLHLRTIEPPDTPSPHRGGSKFIHSQIYYIKNENKSTLLQIEIFISCSPKLKKNILLLLVSDLDWWTMNGLGKKIGKIR